MLPLAHLRDEIGPFHESWVRGAPRDDELEARRFQVGEPYEFRYREEAEMSGDGSFVEYDEAVFAGGNGGLAFL
jgi:hypothetical protein